MFYIAWIFKIISKYSENIVFYAVDSSMDISFKM